MELLLTGKPTSAERAKEIGVVWKLVEPDQLQAEARAWARTLGTALALADAVGSGRNTAEAGYR